MMVDWIQSPWTQPFGRRDLDEDPPRLVDLPFAFSVADAFFARSSAAVFSLTMAANCARVGQRHREWRRTRWRGKGDRRGIGRTVQHINFHAFYGDVSEWQTRGPK